MLNLNTFNKKMSKSLKNQSKRTLVRNTERKLPEVTVKLTQTLPKKQPPSNTHQKKSCQCPQKTVNFDEPKPNSSKTIVKHICAIQNAINIESKTQNPEVLEHKITKRMNFPIDKPIYKNLVPLCTQKEPRSFSSPRNPLPKKDIEPKLSDYCDPPKPFSYVFNVGLPKITCEIEEGDVKFDGCSLTKHLMLWEENPELI